LFDPEVTVLSGLVGAMSAEEAANRAAFGILWDIMDRFPQELVAAMARVFPRGNPSTYGNRPEEDL
jgi:hypothetical protein